MISFSSVWQSFMVILAEDVCCHLVVCLIVVFYCQIVSYLLCPLFQTVCSQPLWISLLVSCFFII